MVEAVIGKTQAELVVASAHIPGRENVKWATMKREEPEDTGLV